MEERRDDLDLSAIERIDHRRLPAAAATQARDRRSRHGAPRRRLHHGRVPAAETAQARDRRSRHGAPRRGLHHGRVPAAASLETSTVTAENGVSEMAKQAETIICRFYQLIPEAPVPRPADRSADGTLPTRGYRYCEAVAAASAFGWYLYPPLNFSLVWDGVEIAWTYEGAEDWYPLRGAQFPGFRPLFEEVAPDPVKPLAPPFLVVAREPGVVQIWSGYLARTAPGWALLSRGPANIPRTQGYEHFEGIIEAETWFGPLFTNLRLTRTNSPVEFHMRYPLFQVQPLLRECYSGVGFEVVGLPEMSAADWQNFEATMKPNTDQMRMLGHYAVGTRRQGRKET